MESINVTNISPVELLEMIRSVIRSEIQSTSSGNDQSITKPLTGKELCDYLGISEPTLSRYRKKGKIPCFIIGDQFRYNVAEVLKALEVRQNQKL